MSFDRLIRWILFCAGIITSIFAGYMFYTDNVAAGAAWLAMAVGFLCFATRIRPEKNESQNDEQNNKDLHDLAILLASLTTASLKNIGRTIPPGTKEIEEFESKLNDFLDVMPLSSTERDEIADEFERIRNRSKRNEGGRAILKSSRL